MPLYVEIIDLEVFGVFPKMRNKDLIPEIIQTEAFLHTAATYCPWMSNSSI